MGSRVSVCARAWVVSLAVALLMTGPIGCTPQPDNQSAAASAWVGAVIEGDTSTVARLTDGPVSRAQLVGERQLLSGARSPRDVESVQVSALDESTVAVDRVVLGDGDVFVPDGYSMMLTSERPYRVMGRYAGDEAGGVFYTPGVRQE